MCGVLHLMLRLRGRRHYLYSCVRVRPLSRDGHIISFTLFQPTSDFTSVSLIFFHLPQYTSSVPETTGACARGHLSLPLLSLHPKNFLLIFRRKHLVTIPFPPPPTSSAWKECFQLQISKFSDPAPPPLLPASCSDCFLASHQVVDSPPSFNNFSDGKRTPKGSLLFLPGSPFVCDHVLAYLVPPETPHPFFHHAFCFPSLAQMRPPMR